MQKEPTHIGELYKDSFEDFNHSEQDDNWSSLEMKLERLKFFKFGFTYFNIYYASIIGITFLFSSVLIVKNFINADIETLGIEEGKNNYKKTNKIIIQQTQELSSKNNYLKKETTPSKKQGQIILEPAPTSTNGNSIIDSIINGKRDTATIVVPLEKKEEKKSPKKKIVYITKQDTIIVMDTIKTKNKRKLR